MVRVGSAGAVSCLNVEAELKPLVVLSEPPQAVRLEGLRGEPFLHVPLLAEPHLSIGVSSIGVIVLMVLLLMVVVVGRCCCREGVGFLILTLMVSFGGDGAAAAVYSSLIRWSTRINTRQRPAAGKVRHPRLPCLCTLTAVRFLQGSALCISLTAWRQLPLDWPRTKKPRPPGDRAETTMNRIHPRCQVPSDGFDNGTSFVRSRCEGVEVRRERDGKTR